MINLDEHQEIAVKQMKNGCILCGPVGSGKSITSLEYYLRKESSRDLYVITTAKKRDSKEWEFDATKYFAGRAFKEIKVVDSWNNITKYLNIVGAFFIFDEQRLVGSGAWVKAFYQIAKKNRWILLSATPGDKWEDYIPVFVANGFYKNKSEFCRRHCVYDRYSNFPKVIKYLEVGRLVNLKRSILVDIEYAAPANRNEFDIIVDYDKELYSKVQNPKTRWNVLQDKPIENISEYCSVLRTISNSHNSRMAVVKKLVEEHPKVIIFYNFDYELEALRNGLKDKNVAEWNGHKHMPIPKTAEWVYLVQYLAGSEGWNCIETNTVIFYSQTYSFKTLEQAMGRVDRRNTPFSDLYFYHLRSDSPMDKSIKECLKSKTIFNEKEFAKKTTIIMRRDRR